MAQYTKTSIYGYTPTEAWCTAYVVLFSVSALMHSAQAYRAKYWIIYPTLVLGCLTEILGWSGRLWSSQNVLLLTPFLLQICTLIMAPVFFSAYIYALLGSAINTLGPQYSIIPAKLYFTIFIIADLISLILQAVGGGQAAAGASSSAPTKSATNIMVAGIIFQLVSMFIFILCAFDFMFRARAKKPYAFRERKLASQSNELKPVSSDQTIVAPTTIADKEAGVPTSESTSQRQISRWWIMMIGVTVCSAMIFCRGIYRSIELVQGWSGYLIEHEIYQNVLDGLPMIIAVGIFNIINPGWVLGKKASWKGYH